MLKKPFNQLFYGNIEIARKLNIDSPKNLEKITRIFFNQRRKMLKKPFNQVFNGNIEVSRKLNINLNLRPQNLDFETYYKLVKEYESLRS